MWIEYQGVTLKILPGKILAYSHQPAECTRCHLMTCFFENRNGETFCTHCHQEGATS